jgi:hypothetical protein
MRRAIFVIAAALTTATSSSANDTIAEAGAGGLALTRSADIDMVSEDLFISPRLVRVRYLFRNRSPRAVRTTVAFPMPDRDFSKEFDEEVHFPSGFRTLIDGRPVPMRLERRAFLKGREVTALLNALGAPLVGEHLRQTLDALPAARRAQLQKLGLAGADDYDAGHGWERHLAPMWTVKERWYWDQTFPAGRNIQIEHSYVPGVGVSNYSPTAMPGARSDSEDRQFFADYCIQPAFVAAAVARARPHGQAMLSPPTLRISYVLTTGANWRAPIGAFRLVVDKIEPDVLVSFCENGVRRISPTKLEVRHTNWRPTRDLKLLFLP